MVGIDYELRVVGDRFDDSSPEVDVGEIHSVEDWTLDQTKNLPEFFGFQFVEGNSISADVDARPSIVQHKRSFRARFRATERLEPRLEIWVIVTWRCDQNRFHAAS